MDSPMTHTHGTVPYQQQDHSHNATGLDAGGEGDNGGNHHQHRDKPSVFKKLKEKAKKIKDTLKPHSHGTHAQEGEGHEATPDDDDMDEEGRDDEDEEIIHHDQDLQRRAPLVAVPSAGESARSYNEGEPKGSAAAAATASKPIRSGDEGAVEGLAEQASVSSGPFSSGTGSGLLSPVLEDAAGRKLKEDPHASKDKSDHDYPPSNYEDKVTDPTASAGESARSYNEGEPKGSAAATATQGKPIRSGDEGAVKGLAELASVPSGPFSSGTGSGLLSPALEDAAGRKLKEDPHASKDKSDHDYSPSNYEDKVTDPTASGESARSYNEGEPKGSAAATATEGKPIRSGDEGAVKGLAELASVPSGPFSSGTGSGLLSPVLEDAAGRKLKEDPHASKDKSDHDYSPSNYEDKVTDPTASGESARSYNEGEPKGSAAATATQGKPIRSGDEGAVKGLAELASVPSGPISSGTGSGLLSPVLEDAAGRKLKEDPHASKDKSDHDYSPSNYEDKVTDPTASGESARSYNEGEPKGSAAATATQGKPIRSGDEGAVKGLAELASVPSGPFSSGTGSGLLSPALEDAAGRKLKEDPHASKDKSDHDYSPSNYEDKVTDPTASGESARSYNEGEPKGSAAATATEGKPIRSGDEGAVKGLAELASVPSGPFSSGTGSGLLSPVLGRKLKEDPHTSKDKSDHDYSPSNYEDKVTDPTASGGGESGVSQILKSMDKVNIYGDKEAAKPEFPSAGSHDQFSPAPNKDIKATAQTAKPASMTVEYGKKIAATVAGTLSPVYDKVVEVGASVVSRVQGGTTETDESGIVNDKDKGVSVKEYFAEKLRPGEEDRALSQVISEGLHKQQKVGEEAEAEAETGAGEVVNPIPSCGTNVNYNSAAAPADTAAAPAIGGNSVVGKLKDTVGSWFGKPQPSLSYPMPSSTVAGATSEFSDSGEIGEEDAAAAEAAGEARAAN